MSLFEESNTPPCYFRILEEVNDFLADFPKDKENMPRLYYLKQTICHQRTEGDVEPRMYLEIQAHDYYRQIKVAYHTNYLAIVNTPYLPSLYGTQSWKIKNLRYVK